MTFPKANLASIHVFAMTVALGLGGSLLGCSSAPKTEAAAPVQAAADKNCCGEHGWTRSQLQRKFRLSIRWTTGQRKRAEQIRLRV